MSMVSTVAYLAQAVRSLATKTKNKAIKVITVRIAQVEKEQRKCEQHRSKQMIDCHNRYYKEKLELEKQFKAKLEKLETVFNENKRTIALTHQAASDCLKREKVMLEVELDNLTK